MGLSAVAVAQTCPYGPEQCTPGYVWRDAFPGDHVCVTPDTRAQAAADNAAAPSRKVPNGPYGPDTCVPGYVWREANPADHVCVTGAVRAQTAADQAKAAARVDPACAAGKGPANQNGGVVVGSAPPPSKHSAQTGLAPLPWAVVVGAPPSVKGSIAPGTPVPVTGTSGVAANAGMGSATTGGSGLILSPPPPPPATGAQATAGLLFRTAAIASFDRMPGSLIATLSDVLPGYYLTMDQRTRFAVQLQAQVPGVYRARVTVSNIANPTTLHAYAPAGLPDCMLAAGLGYRNVQVCEFALPMASAGTVMLNLGAPGAQVTLLALDVVHEAQPGVPDATAHLDLPGFPNVNFDALPGAQFTVALPHASTGGYVEVEPNVASVLYLLNIPMGTYRLRVQVSNVNSASELNLQAAGREWNCALVPRPGYQNTQSCDLVVNLPASNSVAFKFTPRNTNLRTTLDQIQIFKEQ